MENLPKNKSQYKKFVNRMISNMDNDQFFNLIKLGLEDGDGIDDYINTSEEKNIKISKLIPLQNNLDLSKSVYFLLYKKPNFIYNTLDSDENNPVLKSKPIVVFNTGDKYFILDGHHRAYSNYLLNPDCYIKCIVFKKKNINNPFEMLTIAKISEYYNTKNLESEKVTGLNIFNLEYKNYYNYLNKLLKNPKIETIKSININRFQLDKDLNISNENFEKDIEDIKKVYKSLPVINKWKKQKLENSNYLSDNEMKIINIKNDDDLINYIWSNIEFLKKKYSEWIQILPPRYLLPQLDDLNIIRESLLEGKINWNSDLLYNKLQ